MSSVVVSKMCCQRCGEQNNFQTFPMAFAAGTSMTESRTSGVGFGASGGGLGVGVATATTVGTSMSLVAQRLTPPPPRSYFTALITMAIGGFMVILGIFVVIAPDIHPKPPVAQGIFYASIGLVIGFFCVRSCMKTSKWNREEFPSLRAGWEESWICFKCGHTWRGGEPASLLQPGVFVPPAPPSQAMSDVTYYYVDSQGQTNGPVSFDDLIEREQAGQVTSGTNVIVEGASEWSSWGAIKSQNRK